MLFVRCARGISHNPAEAVTLEDVEIGTRTFLRFIERFDPSRKP
jgi:allantoate deiminase